MWQAGGNSSRCMRKKGFKLSPLLWVDASRCAARCFTGRRMGAGPDCAARGVFLKSLGGYRAWELSPEAGGDYRAWEVSP